MRYGWYEKGLVVVIIVLFISVSFAPSINANINRSPKKGKLVETAVRIHKAKRIIPYSVKLTEKESDEVDRIFDDLKIGLDSAETGEEIDVIYDDAVESLYVLGMFSNMTLKDAKQLVNGKSNNQRVTESSSNLGNADENFDCRIAGETTETFMFNLSKPFWNLILNFIRIYYQSMWQYNLHYYEGKIEYMTFSSLYCNYFSEEFNYDTAEGWVHTNGSNGVIKWEGKFYGNIETWEVWGLWSYFWQIGEYAYIGVRDFEGLFIDRLLRPPCYLGNAEHVSLTYDKPPIPPWY